MPKPHKAKFDNRGFTFAPTSSRSRDSYYRILKHLGYGFDRGGDLIPAPAPLANYAFITPTMVSLTEVLGAWEPLQGRDFYDEDKVRDNYDQYMEYVDANPGFREFIFSEHALVNKPEDADLAPAPPTDNGDGELPND